MSTEHNGSSNIDVYSIVTNKIISHLKEGTVPWQKPWREAGIPMNLISKRPYRGINLWLLGMEQYERNLFLTFDQVKKIGGSVKKGCHGHLVIFWSTMQKNQTLEEAETSNESNKRKRTILRYYKVWNIGQCDNIPEKYLPTISDIEFDPLQECEAVISAMPNRPSIKFKEQQAYYQPENDFINMPKQKTFKSIEGYYATLFHELVHSTGHASRLNRKSITEMHEMGGEQYSIEELIAELGSCYLCNYTGILEKSINNSAAYIDGWLQRLKNDKRFIVYAGAHAQRAVDYIRNVKEYEQPQEVEQSEVLLIS